MTKSHSNATKPNAQDVARDRFVGCLLGGAVGDALGAPVEFMSLEQIRQRFAAQLHGAQPIAKIADNVVWKIQQIARD